MRYIICNIFLEWTPVKVQQVILQSLVYFLDLLFYHLKQGTQLGYSKFQATKLNCMHIHFCIVFSL